MQVNDSTGNYNNVSKDFSVDTTLPVTVGGGSSGGGSSGDTSQIPTIAIKNIDASGRFNELQRAILFARINKLCEEDKTGKIETLTVVDYSGQCSLTKVTLEGLISKLASEGISISPDDLVSFYSNYNDKKLEQVFFSLEVIEDYDLFTAVLGLTNQMLVNPPRLDKPFILYRTVKNTTIEYIFTVNKDIRDCSVLSGDGFSCEVLTPTSAKLILNLNDTDFLDKVFIGEISITSDAEASNLEVKRVSVIMRVYNLSYPIAGIPALWILIFLGIVLFILAIFFITRSKLQRDFRKTLFSNVGKKLKRSFGNKKQ